MYFWGKHSCYFFFLQLFTIKREYLLKNSKKQLLGAAIHFIRYNLFGKKKAKRCQNQSFHLRSHKIFVHKRCNSKSIYSLTGELFCCCSHWHNFFFFGMLKKPLMLLSFFMKLLSSNNSCSCIYITYILLNLLAIRRIIIYYVCFAFIVTSHNVNVWVYSY